MVRSTFRQGNYLVRLMLVCAATSIMATAADAQSFFTDIEYTLAQPTGPATADSQTRLYARTVDHTGYMIIQRWIDGVRVTGLSDGQEQTFDAVADLGLLSSQDVAPIPFLFLDDVQIVVPTTEVFSESFDLGGAGRFDLSILWTDLLPAEQPRDGVIRIQLSVDSLGTFEHNGQTFTMTGVEVEGRTRVDVPFPAPGTASVLVAGLAALTRRTRADLATA